MVFAVSIFGSFPVLKVHAQAAAAEATVTKQDLLNSGNAVFNTFLAELAQRQANPRQIPSLTTATDQVVANYVLGVSKLIPAIVAAQGTFVQLLNTPAAASTNIFADYTAALNAAHSSINLAQSNTFEIRTVSQVRTEVTTISTRIRLESQNQQSALINSGQGNAALAIQSAVGTQRTQQVVNELESTCSLLNIISCLDQATNWIIKNILLEIAGFLVWVTANIFNYSVQIGILNFSKWAPDALYPIWIIIRQIISLLIVFIGLYLGFMYILGKDEKFAKYVPWVIAFALFVNFSYPLVRTAIDLSNIVSLKVYVSAIGPGALDASFSSEKTAGAIIRDKLGLQSLAANTTATGANSNSIRTGLTSTPASLMALFFTLYAAYIFFMVSIIMVTRTAALVFLIVASPLLFVDSVLPMLGDKAMMLRKIFFEQLAVGPIFMIMLALTLKFLDVFQVSGAFTGLSSGDQTIKTFFNLLMMLVMLHIMMTVTKKTAGAVGEFGTKAMGTVGGFALGAAAGGTGLLARKGIGGLAAKARDSKWVTNNQDSFIGRRAYNLSNSVANSTFDLRNTAVAGKMAGIGMGMGMGAKLGYSEETKAKMEARTKEALAKSARIKTHYERDMVKDKIGEDGKVVYEEVDDGKGGKVKRKVQEVVHRKGDVDADAWKAKDRLITAAGGGTLFMTKKQKQDLRDTLGKTQNEEASKRIAENEANSTKDAQIYKSINEEERLPDGKILTIKQSKARFLAGLENELKTLEKTDPTLQGNQAQSLMKSIQSIKKTEAAENAAFDKQVKDVFFSYNNKIGAERENYLSNQSKEIFDAVHALKDEALAIDKARDEALDLDLTGTPEERRVSGIAAAANLRGQVESILAEKDQNGAVPIYSSAVDIPFDVSTQSFAEKVAATRKAKLKLATQAADAYVPPQVTQPDPATPIPSATAQAPSTPAANDSKSNTATA